MTDENATPENGEWGEWGNAGPEGGGSAPMVSENSLITLPGVTQFHPARADYPLTLSFNQQGQPTLTLRAETAADMNSLITQVEMAGLWANIGSHLSTVRAQGTLGAGMPGQVQAAPQQPQPMQVTPQGIPMMPQAQMGPPLGAGGMPGTAPAQWQNAGAPQQPMAAQPGWFRVNIPYASKNVGDQIKQNLKNAGLYQGNMRWDGASKTWLVSPAIVAHFAQFNPTPA